MSYQSILQPALDMLSILNDPNSGIPAVLGTFENSNTKIESIANSLTSGGYLPTSMAFADPSFLTGILPAGTANDAQYVGNSAIAYLYAVLSIMNKAAWLVQNLQALQQVVTATHSNLLAYASKSNDPPAVPSLSQPEQDIIQQTYGVSYQTFIQKNWDIMLDPSMVNLEAIYLGKFPHSALQEYAPPDAPQVLHSAFGKIDQAIDDHFRPWATAIQILLQNFLDNVKSLQSQLSQTHYPITPVGLTPDQIMALLRQAPQGVTTLDNLGNVIVLVNAPPSWSPFTSTFGASALEEGTAQEIDKQVHDLIKADGLPPIDDPHFNGTIVDLKGFQSPENSQVLLDFFHLPDVPHNEESFKLDNQIVQGHVRAELVDPLSGQETSLFSGEFRLAPPAPNP